MRNFCKTVSKQISFESNKEKKTLEKRVKDFEHEIPNLADNQKY